MSEHQSEAPPALPNAGAEERSAIGSSAGGHPKEAGR